MSNTSAIIQLSEDTPDIDVIMDSITHIHASCIEHDHTEATFIPPLSWTKMRPWWQGYLKDITAGTKHVWVAIAPISSRKVQLQSPLNTDPVKPIQSDQYPGEDCEVVGVVCLSKVWSETGPFRGVVLKLLVSPNHRQKGIAKKLMTALEVVALKEGKWQLLLDTAVGSPAEMIYPKLGWTEVGRVPEYGYTPVPGKMCDEVWFYKNLKKGTLANPAASSSS